MLTFSPSIFENISILSSKALFDWLHFLGYRSPLRPIPNDLFPDPYFTFDHARDSNDHGHTSSSGGESKAGNCEKEEWWFEVTKVADQVENLQKALDLTRVVSLTRFTEFSNPKLLFAILLPRLLKCFVLRCNCIFLPYLGYAVLIH